MAILNIRETEQARVVPIEINKALIFMNKEPEIEKAIAHRNSLYGYNASYPEANYRFFVYAHGSLGAIKVGDSVYSVNFDRSNPYSIASLANRIKRSNGYAECKYGVHLFVCHAAKDCGGGLILAQELANELELTGPCRGVVAIEGLYGFDGAFNILPDELLFVPLDEPFDGKSGGDLEKLFKLKRRP
jgi:hypothetical protein